jgi:outer membrane protein
MTSMKSAALAALIFTAAGAQAHAQDASRWTVHLGPAVVSPQESASVRAGGALVPGGDVSIAGRWTVEGELQYAVSRNFSLALAAGYPPTFTVMGAGNLAALGEAGKMTGGPAALLAQWHFNRNGRIQPYVGAGASFLIVFATRDGALSNLKARDAVGTALQAGVDVMVDKHWGLYADLKKAWVGTTATGNLGPIPAASKVAIDPLVPSFGATYRF